MTPTTRGSIGSRRLGVMLLGVALIGSLFVPTTVLAIGPSVTVTQAVGQADPTGTSPINFTVVFTDPVERFTDGDVVLDGTVGGTLIATVTGGPNSYNVAVTGMTTGGTVIASVPAGVAENPAGEDNLASIAFSTDNIVRWAPGGPSVTINQAPDQPDPAVAQPITFLIEFSAAVDPAVLLSGVVVSGTAEGKVAGLSYGPVGSKSWKLYVAVITKSGTVIVTLPEGWARTAAGQPSKASTSTDNTVTIKGTSVTINKADGQADPTGTSPVNFTVVFSDPVQGFTGNTFTHLFIGGTAGGIGFGAATAAVTGGPSTYNVAVAGMTTAGTVFVRVRSGAAQNAAGEDSFSSTTTDNVVQWSPGGPSVTINQAAGQADPTTTAPIYFLVAFSASVTGFTSSDVTITGTAGGTKTASVTGSGTTYEVAVSGMTTAGTVIATVIDAAAVDASGRPSLASTSTDGIVTLAPPASTVTLTTSAPTPPGAKDPVIRWGQGFTLGVQFDANGASRTLQLQGTRDEIAWTTIATLTTDGTGRASFFYRPATNQSYRAVFAGTPDLAPATSNHVRTVVRQLAVMRPTNLGAVKVISRDTSITFTTTVRPARPELAPATVSFFFYQQVAGTWKLVTKRAIVTDRAGLARTTFQFTSSGQWYVRSQAGPTRYNANSVLTAIERYSVR